MIRKTQFLSGMVDGFVFFLFIAAIMYWPRSVDHRLPVSIAPVTLSNGTLVALLEPALQLPEREVDCLAKNIFFEAGVEGWDGKIGVGQVTLNRVNSKRWDGTICEVVYARKQFSWTNSKKLLAEVPRGPLWEASRKAARDLVSGIRLPELKQALFYHTDYIETPAWASPKFMLAQVGQHLYYHTDVKR